MADEDSLFDDIRVLSDEADAMGLEDVAIVLEFALDVLLRKQQMVAAPDDATDCSPSQVLARTLATRKTRTPLPQIAWTMSTFPLAELMRKAS